MKKNFDKLQFDEEAININLNQKAVEVFFKFNIKFLSFFLNFSTKKNIFRLKT